MFTGVEGEDIVDESDPEPVSFHLPTDLPEHIEIIRSLDLTVMLFSFLCNYFVCLL